MSQMACNQRPPEGHPWHGSGVACHLRTGHGGPHAWELQSVSAMVQAVRAGVPLLIGTCETCGHWFPVEDFGESCPGDVTEERSHAVNFYNLCGVRRVSEEAT